MARALAEQDAKRFASYYTDDARMLSHGQPIIRGRAEIEAEVRDWVKNGPVTLRFENRIRDYSPPSSEMNSAASEPASGSPAT